MVGIVPRAAKLMELTGLFSGKANSLLGRGVGSLTLKGAPVGPCRGDACPSRALGLRSLVLEVRVQGFSLSRDPVLHRARHALQSQKTQKTQKTTISVLRSRSVSKGVATGSETGLSVILKSWANLEELSSEGS